MNVPLRAQRAGNCERAGQVGQALGWCVWAHAAVVAGHFAAHVGSDIWLAWWAALYVVTIIIAGPFVGLGLWHSGRRRAGACVVTGCMAAALVFGVINHFFVPGSDHVAAIPDKAWRLPFQGTAAALAVTETLGTLIGVFAVVKDAGVRVSRQGSV